jgi:DNA-binding response OmpR family regulator
MPHPKILCLSYDATVSEYRREALKKAGYEVVATADVKEVSRLLDAEQFDLLILGHRFSAQQKRDVMSQAKKRQPLPVLLVCGASADSDVVADGRVYALQGLEGLLAGVAKLLPLTTAA